MGVAKVRVNIHFDPSLLKNLPLWRNVFKSAIIETAVAFFLPGDASERLKAVFAR